MSTLKKGDEIRVPKTRGRKTGDQISISDTSGAVLAIGKVIKFVMASGITYALVRIIAGG